MIDAAGTKFVAKFIGSGKTKVSDSDTQAIVKAKDVFRLQIPMIDTKRVAILDCV